MAVNTFLIRVSKGRIGSKLGTQTILILYTIGRKSGQLHGTPIAYFFRDGKYLVVESNWGKDQHADWYLNLQKNSRARSEVNGETVKVDGNVAEGNEYTHLWTYDTSKHSPYLEYQKMTKRRIPIAILNPID